MPKKFPLALLFIFSLTVIAAAQKARPDLGRDNLKGKVKTVQVDMEIGGEPRQKLFTRHYDEKGFTTRHIWANSDGQPALTIVFGFDKGRRASLMENAKANAKTGAIYTSFYASRYDSKGRVLEEKITGKKGELSSRTVFTYGKNKRTSTYHNKDNIWTSTLDETLDAGGNATVQTTTQIVKGKPIDGFPPTTISVKYDASDKKGNWTKRTVTNTLQGKNNTYTEYRTIEYY